MTSLPSPAAALPATTPHLRSLLLLLVAGAVVRLLLWSWFQDIPPSVWDEKDYNAIAHNLITRGEFALQPGVLTSLRPPLYPTFLAGVYYLFGLDNYQAVRFLQIVMSLGTVVLVYLIGLRSVPPRVAWLAAALYCFYPSMLGYNNLLLTEVLFTLFLCAAIYAVLLLLERGTLILALASGLLFGLAALTRSVVWLFIPFLVVFLVAAGPSPLYRRLLTAGGVVVAFALTIAPWAVRNTALQQTFVPIDVMGGRNFMMGNYRYTPLYRSWDAVALTGEQSWDYEISSTYPAPERSTQGLVDKLALKQGLQFVRENPGLTLQRDVIKFFDFWGLERELVAGAGRGYFGHVPRAAVLAVAVLIPGSYAAAIVLALFGMVVVPPRNWRAHLLFLLVIAFVCGIHTVVFAHSRYHLPLVPLILLYTATALVQFRAIVRQRCHWRFWLAGSLVVLLIVGWCWGMVAGDWDRITTTLQSYLRTAPVV